MIAEQIKEILADFDESCFPNEFLDDYEILECLSQNEIGETYLVKDMKTGEFCVAKCYSDWSFFSQVNESELLKRIHFKGLPMFIAEYHNEESLCVVRSWAKGEPLHKLLRKRRFTTLQCFSIAMQLCDILSYLHQQDPPIIHRDIKPQNVIIDDEGQITLIDFGISRIYDENAKKDTFCLGTSDYAAPEQYGFSQTDNRSDIFSFGVFLCWLFTGTVDTKKNQKIIEEPQLKNIITKCTAFDPEKRYRSMTQVKNALSMNRPVPRYKLALPYILLLLTLVLFVVNPYNLWKQTARGTEFKEPLIEQAVRLVLDKEIGVELTEEDLFMVNELYIFGDHAVEDLETFNIYAEKFIINGGEIQRGSITSLDDLSKLKNLRSVSLVYQNITDLNTLSGLPGLENLDLRHNPLEDISPLSQMTSLSTLSLFGSNVSDLRALQPCFRLEVLDVGDSAVRSMDVFEGLDTLRVIGLRKTPLESLENITSLQQLEEIYLSDTFVSDFAPLLQLKNLRIVEVDESKRMVFEKISDQVKFSLVFHE